MDTANSFNPAGALMFANATPSQLIRNSSFIPTIAVLLGILALLLVVGFQIRKHFRKNEAGNNDDPEQMLLLYEEMRRQGELTDSEFRSIKNQILPTRKNDQPTDRVS